MPANKRFAKEALAEIWEEAKQHYDIPERPPKVKMTNAVKTAGSCKYERDSTAPGGVRCRLITVTRHHKTKLALYGTLRHETAHAIAGWLYGPKTGHGTRWQRIDKQLGGDGERCHDGTDNTIDERAKERKEKYAVACGDCGWTKPYMRRGKVYKEVSKSEARDHYRHGYRCPKCKSNNLVAGPRRQVDKKIPA